jgi:hypothetical protein
MGAGTLTLTGVRSPDRPARRESLYRLSYPGPQVLGEEGNGRTYGSKSDLQQTCKFVTLIEETVSESA